MVTINYLYEFPPKHPDNSTWFNSRLQHVTAFKIIDEMNFYHIYNHAIGNENLFRDHGNYEFFLLKTKQYLLFNADLIAFCQMPNHFHILISTDASINVLTKQATNLTISYAKSYNKLFNRKGGLFLRACKIKLIDNENLISNVIMYIHRNPIHHGFESAYNNWIYSSYNDICTSNTEYVTIAKTLSYFGDISDFKRKHEEYKDKKMGAEDEFE